MKRERVVPLAIAAAAGGAFALITPPFDLYLLAWVGLAGLAYALSIEVAPAKDTRARRGFVGGLRGLAFGTAVNLIGLRFVPAVIARFTPLPFAAGVLALVLLAMAQGLVWAACGVARGWLVRAKLPPWAAFAIAAYAATFVPSVFPWTPAGALSPWAPMIQLADTIGERGVTLIVALSAGLLGDAIALLVRRPRPENARAHALARVAAALVIPAVTSAYGTSRMQAVEALRAHAPHEKVGLVEPSIGATTRWDPARAPAIVDGLAQLTHRAENSGARLTVWSESAYPYVLAHEARREPIGEPKLLGRGFDGPVIVGAILQAHGNPDRYNAALMLQRDGTFDAPYDKLHLLWFGEAVPLAAEIPWLRRTFARGLGMTPGDAPVRLDAGLVHAGAMICFEDTLPESGREAASTDPNLLVNLTNDAWFTGSAESEIHLRLSALRAVELRRDLVRAVNGGPSSWIDATGKVRLRTPADFPNVALADAALLDSPPTTYARFGDGPWFLLLLGVVFLSTRRSA